VPIKFFCDDCGKEIFQELDKDKKEMTTIAEIERTCLCSDCLLKKLRKKSKERKRRS